MLSKTKVVTARKAIESLYTGRCTVTEYQKIKKENKSTGFQDVVVHTDVPCRLSFKTVTTTTSKTESGASASVQVTKLFLSPDVCVKPGSKITVTQDDVTTEYKSSGKPAMYQTHQEIVLELFDGWV